METKACVYVVEDDPAMTQALESLIGVIGFEKAVFSSAEDFLRAYEPYFCGCLLLDVRLPGMGGLELQRQLHDIGANLPIIFMTGHGDKSIAVEAMEHGAAAFLEKPFRPKELLDNIKKVMPS
jgi:two-component system, LuxR family, response regulator FixJ